MGVHPTSSRRGDIENSSISVSKRSIITKGVVRPLRSEVKTVCDGLNKIGNQLLNLDKINAKLQKVANGANSLAGIAHNPTVGFFTLAIFVLIVLSADNYIGFSRIATSVFGAGYTSIEESYREFHVKNNIK